MADCACLENRSPFAGTVGSNPTSSETQKPKAEALGFFCFRKRGSEEFHFRVDSKGFAMPQGSKSPAQRAAFRLPWGILPLPKTQKPKAEALGFFCFRKRGSEEFQAHSRRPALRGARL